MPLSDNFMENYRTCCTDSKTRLKVKAAAQDKCLDFNADRLEAEDWRPLMKALRSDRQLHTLVIKSEFPGKRRKSWAERVTPPFHKQGIIDELVDSIVTCMKRSEILSTVQLQSLPLTKRHIESLSDGIRACVSLQNLLLTRFSLYDEGLETLYESVYPHIGLNHIDFSGCCLTAQGAQTIAKIIKTQRLARYDETWKQSLRYREPDQELFPGIRRITLNDNPCLGDEGFRAITHELMDDLWIKAVDFQNCGLTPVSGDRAIELLKINTIISVLDLSRNDKITYAVKRKIKQLLVEKEQRESKGDKKSKETINTNIGCHRVYDWMDSKSDLTNKCGSKKLGSDTTLNQIASVDCERLASHSHLTVELHQTKRVLDDTKRYLVKEREKREELENEKKAQKIKLAEKFTKEWHKRKQIEKERDRLKQELHVFLSEGHIPRIKTKSTKSTSALSTGSKPTKVKKIKSKAKPVNDTTTPYAKVRLSVPAKSPPKEKVKVNKCNKMQTEKKPPEELEAPIVKSPAGKDMEVSNTQQVHLMQKNLDKLNFSPSGKKRASQESSNPSETESESELSNSGFNDQSADYENEPDIVDEMENGDEEEDEMTDDADQAQQRDLSPISRSQWIFNEIMLGKTRKETPTKNFSLSNNRNNEKRFRFDNASPKWDIKV